MEYFHTYFFIFLFMKSAMITVLVAGLTLVSGVSAMTMTDGAMMKDDKMMSGTMDKTMMKDTMMKDDTMMMAKKYVRMSTVLIAKSMGYTWSKDRSMLAEKVGITGYKGTLAQNLKIRAFLTSGEMMIKDGAMMKDDKMMKGDTMAK